MRLALGKFVPYLAWSAHQEIRSQMAQSLIPWQVKFVVLSLNPL